MRNLIFTLPWGRLFKTKYSDGVFKGNPDKYADALISANHNNPADALLFLDRQIPAATADQFFNQTRNIILNRIAGNKRKDRDITTRSSRSGCAPDGSVMDKFISFVLKFVLFGCLMAYVGSCTYHRVLEDLAAIKKLELCK